MRASCIVVAAMCVVPVICVPLSAKALQETTAGSAQASPSPQEIRQQLEQIKKGRTVPISAATGTNESSGSTELRFENTSPFPLIVLVVGPITQRIELGVEGMQSVPVDPGEYEIAVTVVGRPIPPFYGKQTVTPNLSFRHKFVIPAI